MTQRTHPEAMPMRVLFLCTHNSSRSQMAEGLLQARGGTAYAAFSAGTQPRTVHPLAIKAMCELGIDISDHRAKGIEAFRTQPPMDLVVTVCDAAAESCPFFPHARRQEHWGFPDPSRGQRRGTAGRVSSCAGYHRRSDQYVSGAFFRPIT